MRRAAAAPLLVALTLFFLLGPLALSLSSPAHARANGVHGFSGNPATNLGRTCNHCHFGGVQPIVSLSGPAIVNSAQTHQFTMTIEGGQGARCGLGVSATAGALSALESEPNTRIGFGELLHRAGGKAALDGICIFDFEWTAPAFSGVFRLLGAGNSVNNDGQLTGDRAAATELLIEVQGGPEIDQAPVAVSAGPYQGIVAVPIQFDGSLSVDWDGSLVAHGWDFGDGGLESGVKPGHTYEAPGSYIAELVVTDDGGNTSSDQATVNVLGARLGIRSQLVASGLSLPIYVTAPPSDSGLFVLEQAGRIKIMREGTVLSEPFLDITATTRFIGEAGLLGLAFPADYAETGLFYVNYVSNQSPFGTITLARYSVSVDPDVADPNSGEILLEIGPHPHFNHYGGHITFGPDGMLYLSVGDGGTFAPNANSQDLAGFYGKLLRIDVSGGAGAAYTIPTDNPFFGVIGVRQEIWALGLRNPYRFSFDRLTGALYVGDVGEGRVEEVDIQPASSTGGENYGWPVHEGDNCWRPGWVDGVSCEDPENPVNLVFPVHQYDHDSGGCSITGGVVSRGAALAHVQGRYLFGDFCTGQIWTFLWEGGDQISGFAEATLDLDPQGTLIASIVGFGEDGSGDLYIVDYLGNILKIVPELIPVPGLGGWGLAALGAILLGLGWWMVAATSGGRQG